MIEAFVLCKNGVLGALEGEFREVGATLVAKRMGYFNLLNFIWFYWFLKRMHVDVVCDFTGNFSGPFLFIAKMASVKMRIAQYRQSGDLYRRNLLRDIYNYFSFLLVRTFATRIVSNSCAALDFFFGNCWDKDKKFVVIPNGVCSAELESNKDSRQLVRRELGIPEKAFVVGHTGRLHEAKNHRTILDVAKKMCLNFSDVHFVLAGLGVDQAFAEEIAKSELSERIHLLGYRKDVPRILSALDLFYFPSLSEGQPNSLLEALVMGLPCLASDIPAIRECVPADLRNRLVPPFDVDIAMKVIAELRDDPVKRSLFSAKDWSRNHFDSDRLFPLLNQILQGE